MTALRGVDAPRVADRLTPASAVTDDLTRRWLQMSQWLAAGVVFLCGTRIYLITGVTVGFLVAAAMLPLTYRCLIRYRQGVLFVVLGLAASVWGLVLAYYVDGSHQVYRPILRDSSGTLIGLTLSVLVVLWAREVLSVRLVGLCYGLGLLLSAVLRVGGGADNPWKFIWAIPVAVIGLALVAGRKPRMIQVVMLVVLALLSVVFDSRSLSGTFLLAGLLVLWQLRPTKIPRRASVTLNVAMLAAVVAALYNLGTTLLVEGVLGEQAQQRTIGQIRVAGSLILGGRPELAAFAALIRYRPMGYGVGVGPNSNDVLVAKQGMAATGYDPNNGYVTNYMFGGHIELHSIIGDLWASWGLVGLAFALLIAYLLVRNLTERMIQRRGSALLIFLLCWSLWNFMFSPLFSAAPSLVLALGLALPARTAPGPAGKSTLSGRTR